MNQPRNKFMVTAYLEPSTYNAMVEKMGKQSMSSYIRDLIESDTDTVIDRTKKRVPGSR